MPTTFHLTDGTQVNDVTLYGKVAGGDDYTVFYGGGKHTLIPAEKVDRIEKVKATHGIGWYDLPTARWAWEEDARDLRS